MGCTDEIADDILNSCNDVPTGGLERDSYVINRNDIDSVTYGASENLIENITLKPGKVAYQISAVKGEMNAGFDTVVQNILRDTFMNYWSFYPFKKDSEVAKTMDEMQDLVIITELKGQKKEGCFEVWGLENGLYKSSATLRQNDNNGLPFYEYQTEEGQGEKYSRYIYWNTDYETTVGSIKGLLGSGYSLWNLFSKDEGAQVYTNLAAKGVGDFDGQNYWTSSESSSVNAFYVNMGTGNITAASKSFTAYRVRASRSFTAPEGTFSLRDIGPGGGLIYYINGTTYYEENGVDLNIGIKWSNIDNVLIGTTGTAIGDGPQNTLDIINQAGHTDSAAKLCNDLN
jgi:hypothetical protein